MSTLVFPSEEALQLALTSGFIPFETQAAPARYRRTAEGALHVTPDVAPGRAALQQLASLGVKVAKAEAAGKAVLQRLASLGARNAKSGAEEAATGKASLQQRASPGAKGAKPDAGEPTPVLCWAELVSPRRVPVDAAPTGPVLFLPAAREALLPLAGEMLRLGCDRQEVLFASGDGEASHRALLRAMAPPYFTLTGALDHTGGLRAFVPAVPGQHSVWVELGYTHPLARTLQPAPRTLLLITGTGPWLTAPDGPWTDLYQVTDLRLPEPAEDWEPQPAPGRLSVPLRLTRAARTEPASLWVLRENAVAQVESLVHTLPEALLSQLRFAVAGPPESPCIVLRARPGRERPPELGLTGMGYAPLPQLADLFLPCDGLLEPPVRRDRLRALLAPERDTVTWLHPTGGGAFRAERLPESAFHPLDTWVDYVVDTGAAALTPWVRGATFDFEAFEAEQGEWVSLGKQKAEKAPAEDDAESRSSRRRRNAPTEPAAPARPTQVMPVRAAPASGPRLAPLTATQLSAAEEELAKVEKSFLALDAPADSAERRELWVRMAELNGQLGNRRDAGLCWTRALWEAAGPEAADLASRWAEADGAASAAELLSRTEPSGDDVRALASALTRTVLVPGETAPGDVPSLQRWLDRHDASLDVRSLWLARASLDRLAGGDPLGLARAGDRLLTMLQRGLSLARDVPRFLRAGTNSVQAPRLVAQLEAMLERFERTTRRRSSVEAPPALTQAYVHFVFACGLARLGQADRARALAATAAGALDTQEPIHGFLARAYGARVQQALEGLPPETPLPPDIASELNALSTFQRYKVDRLRQASALLEPSERLDPARAFGRGARDLRGEEFAALRDVKDAGKVAAELDRLTVRAVAVGLPAPERQRLVGGVLDTLPRLSPASALPLFDRLLLALETLPGEVQGQLLGDALTLMALFGRADRATELAARLRKVLVALPPESPAWAQGLLGMSLRALRRVGLSRQAAELVEAARGLLTRPKTPLPAQLGVAAGLAMLGHTPEAVTVFDRAFDSLAAAKGALPERLALTRSLAGALAYAPVDVALPGLARLSEGLPAVTDSYNTNSHFCLSVVELADALVVGHVEVGQGTGERARSWLDEDEFLVRRRIHRELEERTT
ncbi:hypothetical protein HPC49_13090 [Pyxidicoccus fallax]|uniref:FtsH ternary system domain-containing protein n=1 Tax=Pyxidicoccus fallax TaxID=394095 RepID=A0A848LFH4_9BACT|nr:hypothetical protein [Pyxidicoccus fallax]NMO17224.1 hypothetical protein [Pyxidicoccus fallax]NPC79170.1 hypothetical protein [Pyxidicoccus fallax]